MDPRGQKRPHAAAAPHTDPGACSKAKGRKILHPLSRMSDSIGILSDYSDGNLEETGKKAVPRQRKIAEKEVEEVTQKMESLTVKDPGLQAAAAESDDTQKEEEELPRAALGDDTKAGPVVRRKTGALLYHPKVFMCLSTNRRKYDRKGRVLHSCIDLCDSNSKKCGATCHQNRKWVYTKIEDESSNLVSKPVPRGPEAASVAALQLPKMNTISTMSEKKENVVVWKSEQLGDKEEKKEVAHPELEVKMKAMLVSAQEKWAALEIESKTYGSSSKVVCKADVHGKVVCKAGIKGKLAPKSVTCGKAAIHSSFSLRYKAKSHSQAFPLDAAHSSGQANFCSSAVELPSGEKNEKMYDERGRLILNGEGLCDSLERECLGCFYHAQSATLSNVGQPATAIGSGHTRTFAM
ncbi:uncharacterized protein LOC141504128 [Macrotis lagotis]|uniref:uncharacterized protein LOC141504128 n=1 Tax=Macrotis lagotis TaxID=92651 RepID=UPI003D6995D8